MLSIPRIGKSNIPIGIPTPIFPKIEILEEVDNNNNKSSSNSNKELEYSKYKEIENNTEELSKSISIVGNTIRNLKSSKGIHFFIFHVAY